MEHKISDQLLIDQYNRNRLVEDHISDIKDIPTTFIPKGKPTPENDTWFDPTNIKGYYEQ
jgi:hypothetical protein